MGGRLGGGVARGEFFIIFVKYSLRYMFLFLVYLGFIFFFYSIGNRDLGGGMVFFKL